MMSATLISDEVMKGVLDYPLAETEAAFWWLGQAGYLIRVKDTTIVIDPYLSDSASAGVVSMPKPTEDIDSTCMP